MKIALDIKKWLALSLLLTVSACSHQPTITDAETTAIPSPELEAAVEKAEKQQDKPSDWQQTYGKQQEAGVNTLSEEAVQIEANLWQRIRSGFRVIETTSLDEATQYELNRLLKDPQYLDKLASRARPYLHHIVTEIDKRNMPMELALLPVVESGFKPQVYSQSGAAGIWQFMPRTGKVFGLHQNWWYDGRRDIVTSTSAALDYLQKLHGRFGDWKLAIAAYNAGQGRVGRAIKKNQEEGKNTDFDSLALPKETVAYIPRLMAVSHLVLQPSYYGRSLPIVKNEPVFEVVNIGSQMDLTMAAEMAGLSDDELHQYNPGFNQWATAPKGPHHLAIPLDHSEQFRQKLAGLSEKDRMHWQRHKISRGESLGGIAKRYATSVAVLKKANKLSSHRIRAGKYLIIPAPADGRPIKAPKTQLVKAPGPKGGKKQIHTVIKGDTWWDLAMAYKVGVKQLAKWNGKHTRDTLSLGQELVVWSVPKKAALKDKTKVDYQIQQGDSLWTISRQFKVSVAEVKEWNGLSSRVLLRPGQMLKLYVDKNS